MRLPWGERDRADARELDEEIRAHLEMAAADRIARGERPEDAWAAARREFGNVGHVKEVTRETWGAIWLERLVQDLTYAVRSLRRAPVFASVAVLTLALGIGANTAMFTVVRGVLLRPLPFRDPGALFGVEITPPDMRAYSRGEMPDRVYVHYRHATRAFERTTTYNTYPATLLGAGEPVRMPTAGVTASFFATLGIAPRLGRAFREGEDEGHAAPIAIIGDRLWRERFGADTAAVGRSVTIEGYHKTIVGVMPPGFDFPHHTQVWVPSVIAADPHNLRIQAVIGRLAPRTTRAQAAAELSAFALNEHGTFGQLAHATTSVTPLLELVVGNVERSLLIFAAAVGLVLLIACANVSNLMLMRATTRRQELGIRFALGASRLRLVRQLLTESVLLSFAGGIAGLGIAFGGVALILRAAPPGLLPRAADVRVDPVVLAVMALTCIVAGVVAGTVPALSASRRDAREALTTAARSTARAPARGVLVSAEAALALVLLVGAGLLMRSFARLRAVDLGFTPEHVITATLDFPETQYPTPELLHDVQRRMSARIGAIPGVRSSAAVNWLPLDSTWVSGDFALADGRALPSGYNVFKPCVTPGYFAVMGIPIREGRGFLTTDDASSGRVVVISESVARRFWAGQSPLGQRITMADHPVPSDWMTIVGIAADVAQNGPAAPRAEAIYQALAQVNQPFFIGHLTFVVRTAANPPAVIADVRSAIHAVDPRQPIASITTMESRISDAVAEPRFRSAILVVFSTLAVLLAAVGIYGVLAYAVTERAREVGIRMALGAAPWSIVRLMLANATRLALPGLVVGLVVSFASTRVLSSLLFETAPTDGATFAGASLLMLVVAMAAGFGPALRASRIDPAITMK